MGEKLKCTEVAEIFKSTPRTINAWCKQGRFSTATKIGGSESGGGSWYVDSEDPMIKEGGKVVEPSVELRIAPEKLEGKSLEAQSIKDEVSKIQAETAKINAQIILEEAQGRRDKPQKLADREVVLNNREVNISNKETSLEAKEVNFAARLKDLETKETALETRRKDADNFYDARILEGENLYQSKKQQADLMETELKKLQDKINDLDTKITTYPAKLKPILDELNQLIKVSNQWGNHYYKKAQNSNEQEYDSHVKKADKFFDLGDVFQKIKEWIGA